MKHTYTKPLADLLSIRVDDIIRTSVEDENDLDVSRLLEL